MNTKYSLGTRALALLLSFIMVLSMIPRVSVAADSEPVVEMDGQEYATLEDALYDVPTGKDAPVKTIKLLRNVKLSFDIGNEEGTEPQKVILDLNDQNLVLGPAVGSSGTKTNGIRVLANSKLTIMNGSVICSDVAADAVKVGIANYGTLELQSVNLVSGSETVYAVNNRGKLILSGGTRIANGSGQHFRFGITNDPYDLVYSNMDATVDCASSGVYVGSMQVERYSRATSNVGGVVLEIKAGTFDRIVEDGNEAVKVTYNITGGTIGAATAKELEHALKMVSDGAVIKLLNNVTLGFDVGTEDGSVSRKVVLDLGGNTLTTAPAVGSAGTKTSGIRVLANSSLTLRNGIVVTPDETDDVKVKVGLANYGTLKLESVQVKAGNATVYSINNRGELTLSGKTTVENGTEPNFRFAVTNDPYEYIYTNRDAVLNVSDAAVTVGDIQIERYSRPTTNAGGIELNISAGTFGSITDDDGEFVSVTPGITGGIFANDVTDYVKEGYRCVAREDGTYKVEFIKLKQEALSFKKPQPDHLVYGVDATFQNLATGGSTNGEVIYEVVRGDCAIVGEKDGIVTILKAGTCVIRATMVGNDIYEDVSAEYELTIERSDREAAFAQSALEVIYGTASVEAPALTVSAGGGDITYQVVSGEEIAAVDAETGRLTFLDGGLGTVVVKAVVAADENYNSCAAEFTVHVKPLAVPAESVQIIGVQGENGWYKDDVTIKAPTGYTLSKTNSFSGEWMESITCTEEGVYTETVYLKNEDGLITDGIVVAVKIDKTAPRGLGITYEKYTWSDVLGKMLGGAQDVDVIFSFEENGSGVQNVEYSLDEGATWKDASYINGIYSTTVAPEYRGKVQFRVEDAAGWNSELFADGKVLIVDSVKPGVSVAFEEGTYRKDGDIIFTAEERFNITMVVTDDNYDVRGVSPVVYVNDVAYDLEWTNTDQDGKAVLTLTDEGEYSIRISFQDRSGNEVVLKDGNGLEKKAELTVIVNRTIPTLSAEPVTVPNTTENGQYYYKQAPIQVKLMIKNDFWWNRNWGNPVKWATDNAGVLVKLNDEKIEANVSKWKRDDSQTGIFYAILTLDRNAEEGTYKIWTTKTEYVPAVGKWEEKVHYSEVPLVLTLDKSSPEVSIDYNENGKNLIESLKKFLLGKDQVDVTIMASDAISGIHHLVYNIGDGVEHVVAKEQMTDGAYTFTIDEDYRNKISVKVYDMVDNVAELSDGPTVVIDRTEAAIDVGASAGENGRYTMTVEDGMNSYLTSSEAFQLIFSIEHKNYDARAIEPIIQYRVKNTQWWTTVDESLLTRTEDEADHTKGTIAVSLPAAVIDGKMGDYEFRCTYQLFDGWAYAESASALVSYDAKAPEVMTICEEAVNEDRGANIRYYQNEQIVTVRVVEKHFSEADTKVEVFYQKTANDEPQVWSGLTETDMLWLHNNDIHTLQMNFEDEGIYTLKVTCADSLHTNAPSNLDEKFVIDLNDPTNLSVTYQEPVAEDTIGSILYRFFKREPAQGGQITAVVTAEDAVSGISRLEVQVDGEELTNVVRNADGTYTLSISEDMRGHLSIHAEDMAKRESAFYEQSAVVVDSIDPVVNAEYPGADIHTYGNDDRIYTNSEEFYIDFEVADANYDLRADNAVIKVGDTVKDLVWSDSVINGLPGGETRLDLSEQGVYAVSAAFADRSSNMGTWSQTFVVDRTKPRIKVEFADGSIQNPDDGNFYKTAQTITVTIEEENFRPELVDLKLVNSKGEELRGSDAILAENWVTNGNSHAFTFLVNADDHYTLTVNCQDMAGNGAEEAYASEFVVDTTLPELKMISYNQKVVHKILEVVTLGFFRAPVQVTITAMDETAGVKTISYIAEGTKGTTDAAIVKLEDTQQPNAKGEITFELPEAFCGTITAMATDYANNESGNAHVGYDQDGNALDKIVVDAAAPDRIVEMTPVRIVAADMTDAQAFVEGEEKVLYFNNDAEVLVKISEANFYAENYTVCINEKVQPVNWEFDGTYYWTKLVLAENGDYVVTVTGKDYSGNEMTDYTSQRIVVDESEPEIKVEYFEINENGERISIGNVVDPVDRDKPIIAKVTIKEHNFRAADVKLLVTARNAKGADIMELDGEYAKDYLVMGAAADAWTDYEGDWRRKDDTYTAEFQFLADAHYTLQVKYEDLARNSVATEVTCFNVDNTDPVIIVDGMVRYCTELQKTVTFKIMEENFLPENVNFSCVVTDATGAFVELENQLPVEWVYDDVLELWKLELTLTQEANYAFSLSYTDPSGRKGVVQGTGETVYQQTITMDHTAPTDAVITCCDKESHYHKDKVTLALRATDHTAGMMAFVITLTPDSSFDAANDWVVQSPEAWTMTIPYNADLLKLNEQLMARGMMVRITGKDGKPVYENGTMSLKLEISPGYHGEVAFTAIDMADNYTVAAPMSVVVDNVAPEVSVALPEANFAEDAVLYYSKDSVTATLTLTEANFYDADPVFKVNGVETALVWSHDAANEVHTAEYKLTAEGHYVLTLDYTDRSGNSMRSYTSETIVIDRTNPVIKVVYDPLEVKSTYEGRTYFADTRIAKVIVEEENFVADDVKFDMTAKNLVGKDVQGAALGGWVDANSTVHECVLTYSNDANYTFDLSYADKAGNEAVFLKDDKLVADYPVDLFTVDKTVPSNITITYSESARKTVLGGTSFYDDQVDVTLTCKDETAGIREFVYSYLTAPGVSGVNSGLTSQTVAATRQGDSDVFVAKFSIPKSALTKTTQFNGYVTVTAVDRSENKTTMRDDERIIVDNIAPTATIEYNAPAQMVNGTAYYADKINATITINEANFDGNDVQVTIVRDGSSSAIKPKWSDKSLDVHVGTFTLDREGDYIVQVSYKDKSGNAMTSYVSGKMVIDQAAPVIRVSNVVPNTANDDEVYTFAITVEDADGNLRAEDIKPVLTAVVRDENGRHIVKTIELGKPTVVAAGKTFVYTVENLTEDAIYTLSCSAKDMALNAVTVMTLDDGQNYGEVRFSINRNGSTFIYGNEETSQLAQRYYVKNVDHDVVIHEINVDPIHNYSVQLNGVELQEGVDFTTTISGDGESEWFLRAYVINSELFAEEGEYNIVLSSVDATNATAYSDLKGLNMTFAVDRTAPSVVIGGLEDGGRYKGTEQVVTIMPSDDGGNLNRVQVLIYKDDADIDRDKPIQVAFDMEGTQLWDYLTANGGQVKFQIPEGYQQKVVVICEDQAYDTDGTSNIHRVVYENVTVSSDSLVIFYANKPLLYGTLGGILVLLLFLFLFFKRKKKDEETPEAKV